MITTAVRKHSRVTNTVKQLAAIQGFTMSLLPISRDGQVNDKDFTAAIEDGTTVASVVYANNEIGTIAPIPQLAAAAHARGVIFHTDAVQAAGQLTLDVQMLGVDMMSLSAHKFYGPKGIGMLYIRDGIDIASAQTGGSHESGRRAGTHNTPFIVGMAAALELAYAEREARTDHLRQMRDALIDGILSSVPDAVLTGHPVDRLPLRRSEYGQSRSPRSSQDFQHPRDMRARAQRPAAAAHVRPAAPNRGVFVAMATVRKHPLAASPPSGIPQHSRTARLRCEHVQEWSKPACAKSSLANNS